MIEVAEAISSLPYPAVSPTENSILNQVLVELQELSEEIIQLKEENETLRERLSELEDFTALERAFDRKRLAALEHSELQPLQKDRSEILRALIAAHGGKMLAKDARQKMRLSKQLFSMLVKSMDEYIETKPLNSDNRKKLLVLKTS